MRVAEDDDDAVTFNEHVDCDDRHGDCLVATVTAWVVTMTDVCRHEDANGDPIWSAVRKVGGTLEPAGVYPRGVEVQPGGASSRPDENDDGTDGPRQ